MPLVRMLVSWGKPEDEVRDRLSNTLYFNVSGSVGEDLTDYAALTNDLGAIYLTTPWCAGADVEVRAYNMSDAKPRPERAFYKNTAGGTFPSGARQIALALSYYADRNLPRRRGRIFTGPWNVSQPLAQGAQTAAVKSFADKLAALGGLNVDWSVYSPTDNANYRISNGWVDDSWDVIRSRKLPSQGRLTWSLNG